MSVPVADTRWPTSVGSLSVSAASTTSRDDERFVRKPVFQLRDLRVSTPLVSLSRNPDSLASRQPVTVTTADSSVFDFALDPESATTGAAASPFAGRLAASGWLLLTGAGAGFFRSAGAATVRAGGSVLAAAIGPAVFDGTIFFGLEVSVAGSVSICVFSIGCGSAMGVSGRGEGWRTARNPPAAMMPITDRTIGHVLAADGAAVFVRRPFCGRIDRRRFLVALPCFASRLNDSLRSLWSADSKY